MTRRRVRAGLAGVLLLAFGLVVPGSASAQTGIATITGHVFTNSGAPSRNTQVLLEFAAFGSLADSTIVNPLDGSFELSVPRADDYKIEFLTKGMRQFAHQKLTFEDADVFTIGTGDIVTVDETLLPGGVLEVTVTDSVSGDVVNEACVTVSLFEQVTQCGGVNGVVRVPDLGTGDYRVTVAPSDGLHHSVVLDSVHVEMTQTTQIAVELDPAAAITASVVERDTRAPAVFACVAALTVRPGGISDSDCTHRTGNDGNVLIGELDPGTYTLLVVPSFGYGMQWVGESGGVGSQYAARHLHLVNGQSVAMGQIEVDPAVTITGHIRDARSNRIVSACASVLPVSGSAFDSIVGGVGCTGTAPDGLGYVINDIGPYDWPVEFFDSSNLSPWAWTWFGGEDRLAAELVPARADAPGVADIRLKPGGGLSGQVREVTGEPYGDFVTVHPFNTRTGDFAGQQSHGGVGEYELTTLNSQDVKLEILTVGRPVSWYDLESSFDTATPVRVKVSKLLTLNLTIPAAT